MAAPSAASQRSQEGLIQALQFLARSGGTTTPETAVPAPAANQGLDFGTLNRALDSAYTVQQGQELLKRLGDKTLQPSLIESYLASRGLSGAVQYKTEMRNMLQNVQKLMVQQLVASGRGHLLKAFFAPLSPEEAQALVQQDQAITAPQRAIAQELNAATNQPYGSQAEMAVNENVPYIPGLPQGTAQPSLQPGRLEQLRRLGPMLSELLPGLTFTQGGSTGDVIKALEESRAQRVTSRVFPELAAAGPASLASTGTTRAQTPTQVVQSLSPASAVPTTPEEKAQFERLLVQTKGDRVDALNLFNLGKQIEAESASSGGQTASTLPPFTIDYKYGARLGESQKTSVDFREAQVRSSANYINKAIASGQPETVLSALEAVYVGGGDVDNETLKTLSPRVTQMFIERLIQETGQFPAAFQLARKALAPYGLFDGKIASELADPGTVAAIQARGTVTGTASGKLTPTYRQAEQQETAIAGERSAQTAYGAETGRQGATIGQPPGTPQAPGATSLPEAAAQTERERGLQTAEQRVQRETAAHTAAARGQRLREADPTAGVSRFYVTTGVDGKTPLHTVSPSANYGNIVDSESTGAVKAVDKDSYTAIQKLKSLVPTLNNLTAKLEKIYGPGGDFEKAAGLGRIPAGVTNIKNYLYQSNTDLRAAQREMASLTAPIARILSGDVGNLAVEEVQRYLSALPDLSGLPDTPELAAKLMNDIITNVNAQIGTRLDLSGFEHPTLKKPNFVSQDILTGRMKVRESK